MRKPAFKQELSTKEQNILIQSLNKFVKWLLKKKVIRQFPNIRSTIELPSSDADWTMRFDEKERAVSFNTFTRKKCSFDYYQSIIIHEFFHLAASSRS